MSQDHHPNVSIRILMLTGLGCLLINLTACDNPPYNNAQSEVQASSKIEADPVQPRVEPLKKNLRVIGEGRIAAPIVTIDEIERVAPPKSAAELNAEQMARLPEKPLRYPRPLALSATELRSGDRFIRIAGITAPGRQGVCQSSDGDWPCGNFARAALQRLVRARTLDCNGETGEGNTLIGTCKVAGTDIAEWMVSQGWAKSDRADLEETMAKARAQKLGLWKE